MPAFKEKEMEQDTTLEDSIEEHISGEEGTTEETNDEEKHEEGTGDEDENDCESGEKTYSEELSESEYSESEESDSLDEGETEECRQKYVIDMSHLEKQFAKLKEQLYKERITQIENQLDKVHQMEAKEYTGPLKQLEEDYKIRYEVAGHLKHYRMINVENHLQCELQSAEQHFKNEEAALRNALLTEYEEKLCKVEEERHTAEMYSDLWLDDSFRYRKKRKGSELFVPDKRKKPVTVTGPYIIYMLNEMDILEDWAAIRKAKSEAARKKASELSADKGDPLVTARYEDGKFFYQGEWFQKSDKVILDNRIDFPVHASITGINTGEVWVSKRDGVKCKLYIAQFHKGKYIIRHDPDADAVP